MKKVLSFLIMLLSFGLSGCITDSNTLSDDDFTFVSYEMTDVLDYSNGNTYTYKTVMVITVTCNSEISYAAVSVKTYDSSAKYLATYSGTLTKDINADEEFVIEITSHSNLFPKTASISTTFSGRKLQQY